MGFARMVVIFFLDFFLDFTYNVKQSVTTIGKTQQYLIEVLK